MIARTLLFSVCIVIFLGAAFIYSGTYNIAATSPHWPITWWAMETVRVRSVAAHAAGIRPPANLDDPAQVVMGTEHFAAHCAVCHGAPGVPRGEIAEGLYPPPANLALAAQRYTPAELFWIVKNGIKMTGMPSWSDHEDKELWATVAFLKKLGGGMSEQEYGKLVVASMALGGHHHGAAGKAASMDMNGMDMKGMGMHEAAPVEEINKPSTAELPTAEGDDHHAH